jgi:hypothetical protein
MAEEALNIKRRPTLKSQAAAWELPTTRRCQRRKHLRLEQLPL